MAVLHVYREGHAVLTLHAVVGVGQVVVRTFDGQRHGNFQRFVELVTAGIVVEGVGVGFVVVSVAASVRRRVVGLDHRLIATCSENYRSREIK